MILLTFSKFLENFSTKNMDSLKYLEKNLKEFLIYMDDSNHDLRF